MLGRCHRLGLMLPWHMHGHVQRSLLHSYRSTLTQEAAFLQGVNDAVNNFVATCLEATATATLRPLRLLAPVQVQEIVAPYAEQWSRRTGMRST